MFLGARASRPPLGFGIHFLTAFSGQGRTRRPRSQRFFGQRKSLHLKRVRPVRVSQHRRSYAGFSGNGFDPGQSNLHPLGLRSRWYEEFSLHFAWWSCLNSQQHFLDWRFGWMRLQLQLQQFEKGFTVLDWDRQLQRDAVEGIGIGFHWSDSCGSGVSSFPRKRESSLVRRNWIPAFAGMTNKTWAGTSSSVGAPRGLSAGYGLSCIRKQSAGLRQQFDRFQYLRVSFQKNLLCLFKADPRKYVLVLEP